MLIIHYNDLQVCDKYMEKSFSKSPLKPKLVLDGLKEKLNNNQYLIKDFKPYIKDDFKLAHYNTHINYVYDLNEEGTIMENDLPWSKELVTSLEYTNASLYSSIKSSIEDPSNVHISLVSGMHHARPHMGIGFCTFSGQCIASIKLYNELNVKGCYIDLDAHFGNSIDDTRIFNPLLNECIPRWANYNPQQKLKNRSYINDFGSYLYTFLENRILNEEINYIVYCHGADSIEGDDCKNGKVTLEQWYECTEIFWVWYKQLCKKLNKQFPVT